MESVALHADFGVLFVCFIAHSDNFHSHRILRTQLLGLTTVNMSYSIRGFGVDGSRPKRFSGSRESGVVSKVGESPLRPNPHGERLISELQQGLAVVGRVAGPSRSNLP